jgi:hypothetical protein
MNLPIHMNVVGAKVQGNQSLEDKCVARVSVGQEA